MITQAFDRKVQTYTNICKLFLQCGKLKYSKLKLLLLFSWRFPFLLIFVPVHQRLIATNIIP